LTTIRGDNDVRLNREQVKEVLKALAGIGNLVNGFAAKSGHAMEFYAVMSNIWAIQTIVTGIPKVPSN
jgi:hypothetical protein